MALVQELSETDTLRVQQLPARIQTIAQNDFKFHHFQPEIILLCVRWYLRYALTYRDLVEMMSERGVSVSHTTIMRWVHKYSAIFNKRLRRKLKPTGESWKLDETYVRVKGQWKYLYRAIDKDGNTLDFYLAAHRNQLAAMRFLKKLLGAAHTTTPRVINTDKNPSYGAAINAAKASEALSPETEHRDVKYLNNRVECDHRRPKRLIGHGLGFGSFRTAQQTISGYEAMNMVRKGQATPRPGVYLDEVKLIEGLFKKIG